MKIYLPNFEKRNGIIPVVVVNVYAFHRDVLMLAYTNKECFLETIETGEAVFFSTSRQERWKKGDRSGHSMKVVKIRIDCDGDALVYEVESANPRKGLFACHTGACSCFFRNIQAEVLSAPRSEDLRIEDQLSVIDVAEGGIRKYKLIE